MVLLEVLYEAHWALIKILIKWTMKYNKAIREASLDIKEGADILLIKPGIMYLDVLREVKILLNFLHLVIKFLENILC